MKIHIKIQIQIQVQIAANLQPVKWSPHPINITFWWIQWYKHTSTHSHGSTHTKSNTNRRAKLYKNTNTSRNTNTHIDKNTKSNILEHNTQTMYNFLKEKSKLQELSWMILLSGLCRHIKFKGGKGANCKKLYLHIKEASGLSFSTMQYFQQYRCAAGFTVYFPQQISNWEAGSYFVSFFCAQNLAFSSFIWVYSSNFEMCQKF